MIFQILDANYAYDSLGLPLVQLFGRSDRGERSVCRVSGFRPYFYAGVEEGLMDSVADELREMGLDVEVVERFLPIGYQVSPTKMLKVITKDPKEVRTLRDRVAGIHGVRAVYETDILFKNRVLIDVGLGGMSWVEVPDDSTGSDVDAQSIRPLKMEANAPLKYMAFDIECLPRNGEMPTPETSPTIVISMAFSPEFRGQKDLVLVGKKLDCEREDVWPCDGEYDLISTFVSIIGEYDPDVLAGYNSNEFDLPYLSERAKRLGLNARVGRDGSSWFVRKIVNQTNVAITGRVVVDLLPIIRSSFSLKQYTLRNAASELLKMEKYDLDPKEIESIWAEGGLRLRKFLSYARRDAVLAMRLLMDLKLMDKYVALSRTSGSLLQDIVNGGQSGMVESLLLRRFGERGRVVPPKPDAEVSEERFVESDELKGGAVLMPEKGLLEDLVILDYKSLYPTIMMAHNLCYSTVVTGQLPGLPVEKSPSGGEFVSPEVSHGIVPQVLRELLDERTKTKRLMKQVGDEERSFLDAKQYAMKILLNSFYGYSGYARARLYSLPMANAVTSFGRENILNTRRLIDGMGSVYISGGEVRFLSELDTAAQEGIKAFSLSVVYGDTDSVFVRLAHQASNEPVTTQEAELIGRKIAATLTASLPDPMELVFEAFARRAIFLTKKRYALWVFEPVGGEWRDRIKVRGMETVRRDWCGLTSKTLRRCLELVLKEGKVDEAVEHVRSVIVRLRDLDLRKDPEILEDLTLTRRYTKSVSSYKNKQPHIQLVEKMRRRGDPLPGIGDRVPFVIVSGQSHQEGFVDNHRKGKDLFVDKAEDPRYAAENNLAIDTEYYIGKQILPPVLRILSEFGITEGQLCASSRQSSLIGLGEEAGAPKAPRQRSLLDF
jgi:DNA polymerase, archaea type